jgi:hypothetical protein
MTSNSAMMFDGTKLNCVSNIIGTFVGDESASVDSHHSHGTHRSDRSHNSSLSSDLRDLVDDVINDSGSTNVLYSIMNHMETTQDVKALRRHVNKSDG